MHPEAPLIDQRSVRTIRPVSDVPDFASLYSDSELTPRSAAKVWLIAELIYDDFHQGFGDEVLSTLPPLARRHSDERFESAFASRFAIIAKRVAEGLPWLESIATCTADEMAVHVILDMLEDIDEMTDPDWFERIPAHEDDDQIGWLEDLLLQDTDVLMLYNPALDGIEDPDSPVTNSWGAPTSTPTTGSSPSPTASEVYSSPKLGRVSVWCLGDRETS